MKTISGVGKNSPTEFKETNMSRFKGSSEAMDIGERAQGTDCVSRENVVEFPVLSTSH